MSESSNELQATVRKRRRLSSVWLVPLVALGLAGWLIWKNRSDLGPLAIVSFETAEGISANKTEVRCRSVKVGMVENVRLADDLGSVDVDLRIAPTYSELLRDGTRFWVVRPRVSTSTVSGLGTLITGAYIELDPGEGGAAAEFFTGLEEPPVTGANVPGLRLSLVAKDAGSLSVGSSIYYRGFVVGQVERSSLDVDARRVRFDVFIRESFAPLVRTGTRFWNTSGFDVSAGAEGFKFKTPSVQALVSGGASFSTPTELLATPPVENGAVFTLHPDEKAAIDSTFEPDRRLLLLFNQSVRGLQRDAPVEFRGIPLGRVVDIPLALAEPGDQRIPVLIELDTKAFRQASARLPDDAIDFAKAVEAGLRARLATGSLITGALYVDLDIFPDAEPAKLEKRGEYDVIPTLSSGLAQLEAKLNSILAKIEALPLDDTLTKFGNAADEAATTLAESRQSLAKLEETLGEIQTFVAADSTQQLPEDLSNTLAELKTSIESLGPSGAVQGDLRRTLDELRAALRSFESLSNTIDEKPNSLLFGRDSSGDPIPKARR
ncbi:paraquat-inducible protein B [Haloferula helveola]|uniref:Paraquat-inducible protein B n=1 Tax=Haloferula helveola TaxID=490095 RepID=A0ABM7RCK6_9BACT|nr:paraquat-inducible protein B [Haloferula helveola]